MNLDQQIVQFNPPFIFENGANQENGLSKLEWTTVLQKVIASQSINALKPFKLFVLSGNTAQLFCEMRKSLSIKEEKFFKISLSLVIAQLSQLVHQFGYAIAMETKNKDNAHSLNELMHYADLKVVCQP